MRSRLDSGPLLSATGQNIYEVVPKRYRGTRNIGLRKIPKENLAFDELKWHDGLLFASGKNTHEVLPKQQEREIERVPMKGSAPSASTAIGTSI
jgi:hypothetical protein